MTKEETLQRLIVTSKIKGWSKSLVSAFTRTFNDHVEGKGLSCETWEQYAAYWDAQLMDLDPEDYPDY